MKKNLFILGLKFVLFLVLLASLIINTERVFVYPPVSDEIKAESREFIETKLGKDVNEDQIQSYFDLQARFGYENEKLVLELNAGNFDHDLFVAKMSELMREIAKENTKIFNEDQFEKLFDVKGDSFL